MSVFYDLHIHSALSPCGDEDMTPNNIVNMSCLLGLDMIALTDHNTAGNVRAVCKAAEGKIKVIPGIEVTTAEEVHTVCYFPSVEAAEDMGAFLKENMQGIKNRPEIFGRQLFMDHNDEITGEEEELLVSAVNLDIYEIEKATHERGGMFVPAHIDRSSYSVLANLGFLPPDLKVDAVEITEGGLEKYAELYSDYPVLTSSDAHYLENISEKARCFDETDKNSQKIIEFLCKF
ncbi:MAG: PHP domain-containing protein [Ruminococcaceae bacterium]|nr:PHP domain-containing protein [Oscillospiraceae bacterium]